MSSLKNTMRRGSGAGRSSFLPLPLVSLLGLLLVPLAIAGLLTWSLGSTDDRLKDVKAAVVNNDEPVEVDGQLAPLGRQLSATLVGDEIKSNYSWEFATKETAEQGLQDGEYVAVVTIPENFSEAATSFSRDPAQSHRAQIDVTTGERGKLADGAINKYVTSTAAELLSNQLTTTYLDNVLVGFNTLNDKLGDASAGAKSLADGAEELADGGGQLADGAEQLAAGSRQLSDGLGELDGGAAQLSDGTSELASGLEQLRQQTAQLPEQSATLADVAAKESAGVNELHSGLGTLSANLKEMQKECPPGILPLCNKLAVQAVIAEKLNEGAGQVSQASGGVAGGLEKMAGRTPDSGGGLPALADGVDQLADGASQLDGGTAELHNGISRLHGGATELADGAGQLSTGIGGLTAGARKLSDGSGELSSGLGQAVEQLPAYSDENREKLSDVVASPVATTNGTAVGFGSSGLPVYAVLALWAGALATFLVLRPMPARMLGSTRSSFVLALRHFALPAGIAVVQGVLVAAVLGWSRELAVGEWFATAGIGALAAVAFTAVNQALAGALGGAGRFVSMLVALIVLANGFVSAVPGVLGTLSAAMPVGPALDGLRATLTGGDVSGLGSVALLVFWALLGLGVTCLAVERQRTVRAAYPLATSYGGGNQAALA
ncbi:YhgE/Pip family protein [Parasphingorhabdus pacifica]